MALYKAIGEIDYGQLNSTRHYFWKPNMDNEILPTILLSTNFYMVLSISSMVLTNIGAIFAMVFLALKNKYKRMPALDYLTINLLIGCILFAISNFITHSYDLFNKPTPAATCIFVQTIQSILWYNQFITAMLIIAERTYNHTSPISHMKMFTTTGLMLVITGGWMTATAFGVMSSLPYNWDKIHGEYSLELCHCESLVFKKVDIAIQVGSLIIPYILVILSFPIARISALKDVLKVRKDLGLDSSNKFYSLPNVDSIYDVKQKISVVHKIFYASLFITQTMKILLFLLKEFNNYQKVVAINQPNVDVYEGASDSKPYLMPDTVIGFFNLLFLLSPIYDMICCILINKSFFKKACYF